MTSNIILIIYVSLFAHNYKEFSLDSIYKKSLRKIEYMNQQKSNNEPKFDAKINLTTTHKRFTISRKMELINSGLLNKNNVTKYLIKNNEVYFVKLIANNYCNCSIISSDIKKEQYNSGVIYSIHKKFTIKEDNFSIKNDFKINIFETGSVIDFSWDRFGERIENKFDNKEDK